MRGLTCQRCRRATLWGSVFCPHCGAYLRAWIVPWTLYLTLLGVLCTVVIIGLAEFLAAQRRSPNRDEWEYLNRPMVALSEFLVLTLPEAARFSLEPHGNYNLQVFLPRHSLEGMVPADRDAFVDRATAVWCENIPASAFVPFVQVRELESNSEVGTARCPLVRGRVEPLRH